MKAFVALLALVAVCFGGVASACPPVAISSVHAHAVQAQSFAIVDYPVQSVQAVAVASVPAVQTVQLLAVPAHQVQLVALGGCRGGSCGVRSSARSRVSILGGGRLLGRRSVSRSRAVTVTRN